MSSFDTSVFLFFNGMHNEYFDSVMQLYSGRFIWIPMYAALLVMLLRRYPFAKVVIFVIGIAATICLADQLCASVIRPMFERLRPSNLDNPISEFTHIVDGYRGGPYGFPSCHAANSFGLAVFAALLIKQRHFSFFILLWATINCYSRIYLGVHYPGDLLAGALVGTAAALLCYLISALIYRWLLHAGKIRNSRPLLIMLPSFRGNLNFMEVVGLITLLVILIASI